MCNLISGFLLSLDSNANLLFTIVPHMFRSMSMCEWSEQVFVSIAQSLNEYRLNTATGFAPFYVLHHRMHSSRSHHKTINGNLVSIQINLFITSQCIYMVVNNMHPIYIWWIYDNIYGSCTINYVLKHQTYIYKDQRIRCVTLYLTSF